MKWQVGVHFHVIWVNWTFNLKWHTLPPVLCSLTSSTNRSQSHMAEPRYSSLWSRHIPRLDEPLLCLFKVVYLPRNLFCLSLSLAPATCATGCLSPQLCCALTSRGWNKLGHFASIPLLQHLLPEGATSLSGGYCFAQHFIIIFPSSTITLGVKPIMDIIMFISVAWNFFCAFCV